MEAKQSKVNERLAKKAAKERQKMKEKAEEQYLRDLPLNKIRQFLAKQPNPGFILESDSDEEIPQAPQIIPVTVNPPPEIIPEVPVNIPEVSQPIDIPKPKRISVDEVDILSLMKLGSTRPKARR